VKLDRHQQGAATRWGQDVCVAAGPGSGKTRVLVERFVWLVEERRVPPSAIVAFTFTEKAANELRKRLRERFEARQEMQEEIERAWVSTIHAFCARLLREHSLAAGIDPEFAVFDEPEARQALSEAAEQALDELAIGNPAELHALLASLNEWDLAGGLCRLHAAMRVGVARPAAPRPQISFEQFLDQVEGVLRASLEGWKPAQIEEFQKLRAWAAPLLALRGRPVSEEHLRRLTEPPVNLNRVKRSSPVAEQIKTLRETAKAASAALVYEYYLPQRRTIEALLERMSRVYEAGKRARSALDFSDLEHLAIRLLESDPELRQKLSGRFQAILLDETQDTNPLQWRLIELLRTPDCFFAVGDVNQSIYRFRHAEPRVFMQFIREVERGNKFVDRLRQNYRSRPEILKAVEAVCSDIDGIEKVSFEPQRRFEPKPVPSVEVLAVSGARAEDLVRKEAAWVAARIRELVGTLAVQQRVDGEEIVRPLEFSDIGILLRKSEPMEQFEAVLRQSGIPCVIARGSHFFKTPEVTDLVRLLHVLENPRDEISLAAVLRSPLVGVSDDALVRMKAAGHLAEALEGEPDPAMDSEDAGRLAIFRRQLAELREMTGYVSPDVFLARVLDESNYWDGLPVRARANIDKFLALVREQWSARPRPLRELLDEVAALRDAGAEAEAPPDDSANAVRMMTIHQAKGLEFPVVFLAHAHTGVNQSQPDLLYSKDFGLGVRWRLPDGEQSAPDFIHRTIAEYEKQREAEEAHRLLFVAMTRAEQHLVVSFSVGRRTLSDWPGLIAKGWGFSLEEVDLEPQIIQAEGRGFQIRLLRTSAPAPRTEGAVVCDEAPAVQLVPRSPRTAQYDSATSVTALAHFRECPRRWLLGRHIGFRAAQAVAAGESEAGGGGLEFGSAVHRLLAGADSGGAPAEIQEMAARFQTSELAARARAAVRCERESPFVFAMDDVVLRGQIDLWFEEADGNLVVVDYKSDQFDPETRQARLEAYKTQLRFYAAALSRQWNKRVKEAWLYLLRENTAEPVALNGEEELVALLDEFRRAQEELDFPMRPGPQCRSCEFYRQLCPGL